MSIKPDQTYVKLHPYSSLIFFINNLEQTQHNDLTNNYNEIKSHTQFSTLDKQDNNPNLNLTVPKLFISVKTIPDNVNTIIKQLQDSFPLGSFYVYSVSKSSKNNIEWYKIILRLFGAWSKEFLKPDTADIITWILGLHDKTIVYSRANNIDFHDTLPKSTQNLSFASESKLNKLAQQRDTEQRTGLFCKYAETVVPLTNQESCLEYRGQVVELPVDPKLYRIPTKPIQRTLDYEYIRVHTFFEILKEIYYIKVPEYYATLYNNYVNGSLTTYETYKYSVQSLPEYINNLIKQFFKPAITMYQQYIQLAFKIPFYTRSTDSCEIVYIKSRENYEIMIINIPLVFEINPRQVTIVLAFEHNGTITVINVYIPEFNLGFDTNV